jgi:hypothetical protein
VDKISKRALDPNEEQEEQKEEELKKDKDMLFIFRVIRVNNIHLHRQSDVQIFADIFFVACMSHNFFMNFQLYQLCELK